MFRSVGCIVIPIRPTNCLLEKPEFIRFIFLEAIILFYSNNWLIYILIGNKAKIVPKL